MVNGCPTELCIPFCLSALSLGFFSRLFLTPVSSLRIFFSAWFFWMGALLFFPWSFFFVVASKKFFGRRPPCFPFRRPCIVQVFALALPLAPHFFFDFPDPYARISARKPEFFLAGLGPPHPTALEAKPITTTPLPPSTLSPFSPPSKRHPSPLLKSP